jgi:hypothetical protein
MLSRYLLSASGVEPLEMWLKVTGPKKVGLKGLTVIEAAVGLI